MRCPYCNALNAERATFCSHCGRDLTQPTQPPTRIAQSARPSQPYAPQPQPPYTQRPSGQPVLPVSPVQPQPAHPTSVRPAQSTQTTRTNTTARPTSAPRMPEPIKAPEPPSQFPPRTLAQLQALESGSMPYTVIDEAIGNGRKRIVRISYHTCSTWQQVATLLKAFKEQPSDKYDTTIIQGIITSTTLPYTFNNGQFTFDRNVRLGSQIVNRYIIETGTGLESDSLRIVLQDVGA